MKNYIIIVDNSESANIIQDKMQSLGKYYKLSEYSFVVSTDRERAQNIYNELSGGAQFGIVVFELKTANGMNYWGYSSKELWKWLSDNEIK